MTTPGPREGTNEALSRILDMPIDAGCAACGYFLRGLEAPRCPECGREFDPSDPTTYRIMEPGAGGPAARVKELLVVVALYVACLAVMGPSLRLSQWYVAPENNQGAAEAMSWLAGRWDLPTGGGDVALYHGHYYNVFPPLWTIICYMVYGLHQAILGPPVVFFMLIYVAIVAAPVPLLCYWVMRRSGLNPPWAALMAIYLLTGTCLRTEATLCQRGWIYSIQHVLSQTGIAIVLIDLLGRRRFWLAGIGVLIAAWSRQTGLAYALPVLWLALRSARRGRALTAAGIPLALTLIVPMALNAIKFGSPFETGYRYIFEGQASPLDHRVRGPNGQVEVFAARYVPEHLYYMWLSPPHFEFKHDGLEISGAAVGSAVWFGTPLLLFVLYDIRRWWRDPVRRALMISTLPIIAALAAYHGPGFGSPGYYRYSMDFVIVWLAVIAPWTAGPTRRWVTIGCAAWSVFYFYMLTPYMGM